MPALLQLEMVDCGDCHSAFGGGKYVASSAVLLSPCHKGVFSSSLHALSLSAVHQSVHKQCKEPVTLCAG